MECQWVQPLRALLQIHIRQYLIRILGCRVKSDQRSVNTGNHGKGISAVHTNRERTLPLAGEHAQSFAIKRGHTAQSGDVRDVPVVSAHPADIARCGSTITSISRPRRSEKIIRSGTRESIDRIPDAMRPGVVARNQKALAKTFLNTQQQAVVAPRSSV